MRPRGLDTKHDYTFAAPSAGTRGTGRGRTTSRGPPITAAVSRTPGRTEVRPTQSPHSMPCARRSGGAYPSSGCGFRRSCRNGSSARSTSSRQPSVAIGSTSTSTSCPCSGTARRRAARLTRRRGDRSRSRYRRERQRVRATLWAALTDAVREPGERQRRRAGQTAGGQSARSAYLDKGRVEQWRSAVERRTTVAADDPMRDVLEKAAQPPSPVMRDGRGSRQARSSTLHEHRLYAAFHVVTHASLRRGELCALRWEDVDLDAATITVHRNLVQMGGGRRGHTQERCPHPHDPARRRRLCACCASTAAARSPTGSCGALRGRTPWTGCSSARTVR